MFDAELDGFKTSIDLRVYLAGQGYTLDQRKSWRGSAVMVHHNGDKLIVKRDVDGHYVFFSVRDDRRGTIIDLIQHGRRVSLGAVRRELRAWLGSPPTASLPCYAPLVKTSKDRLRVETAFLQMKPAFCDHPYLTRERHLTPELIGSDRFAGAIFRDAYDNAVFPHYDNEGLCGFEIRNYRFKGYSAGGTKALWSSGLTPNDDKLVLCEAAIDALSFALLFPDPRARYASIGGKPNPIQPDLIRGAAARLPLGGTVIAAMDADQDGRKLAEVVRNAVELTGRSDLRYSSCEPAAHKDWNDELRARKTPALSCRQGGPSLS